MRNRNKRAFCIIVVVLLIILTLYILIGRNSVSTAKKLLNDDYYDWVYPSEYSFFVEDSKWIVEDIHKRSKEFYSNLIDNNLQIINLTWDAESKTVTECKQKDGDTKSYYLLHLDLNSIVLIPVDKPFQIFEENRPLAFFLTQIQSEDSSEPLKSAQGMVQNH